MVRSKRKDWIVHTLNFTEAEKAYSKMEMVQKKVFAINAVTGGSWSRMVGKVEMAGYKRILKEKRKNGPAYKITVPIPDELKKKKADIFLLRFNKSYRKSDINYITRTLGEEVELELQANKKKKLLYFVIVDPDSTHTVFNRVK